MFRHILHKITTFRHLTAEQRVTSGEPSEGEGLGKASSRSRPFESFESFESFWRQIQRRTITPVGR